LIAEFKMGSFGAFAILGCIICSVRAQAATVGIERAGDSRLRSLRARHLTDSQ
jgi:hypothetical protein